MPNKNGPPPVDDALIYSILRQKEPGVTEAVREKAIQSWRVFFTKHPNRIRSYREKYGEGDIPDQGRGR